MQAVDDAVPVTVEGPELVKLGCQKRCVRITAKTDGIHYCIVNRVYLGKVCAVELRLDANDGKKLVKHRMPIHVEGATAGMDRLNH